MRHLIILLSVFFVSLGVFITGDSTYLRTDNGCKLITSTQVPVEKNSNADSSAIADDYYQPLSPVSRFLLMQ